MKKVERINTMMRYISNRSFFTISEIMREFEISRSTAIRDINEIESMEMPLEAEVGRDGGYTVMNNSVLPSIHFTDNEVKALFIAFMASRNQQLPYLESRQSIAEKLLGLIPQNQQDNLVLLNQILLFESTHPNNPNILDLSDLPNPILEKLIGLFLEHRYISITIEGQDQHVGVPIYLLHLYREKHLWLMEGFDLNDEIKKTFHIDRLIDVEVYKPHKKWSKRKIKHKLAHQELDPNLMIELGPQAIAQYHKYHPFKFTLSFMDPFQTQAILKEWVDMSDKQVIADITNWILFLGEDIKLKLVPNVILDNLKQRSQTYQ
ncbi:HTH domain-containing protein [Staphylococcus sp. Marseille-Q5304]|uniref:helix-turn-helix transcriptional regulator n=1 Tax=Staphylococcus sp. Marseille-Q5304 TaxID=2942200 RepID=UPI0020747792|nr:HTH domain-containing protein [Staphylococcus sp. Marseille-Q5304]